MLFCGRVSIEEILVEKAKQMKNKKDANRTTEDIMPKELWNVTYWTMT